MARTVTLETLISDVRLYADMRGSNVATSGFLTDAELTRLINLQLTELYDLLLAARGQDYYITSDTISIVNGTASYALPDDFYQLKSLTLEWSSQEHELVRPINSVAARVRFENDETWDSGSRKGYRMRGGDVEFLPTPTRAVTCRVQYVPAFTDLVASGGSPNTFDGVNGWEKLVVLGAAIEALKIEEKVSSHLQDEYARQYARIQGLAADRDADNPMQIEDVCPEENGSPWYPTGGLYLP